MCQYSTILIHPANFEKRQPMKTIAKTICQTVLLVSSLLAPMTYAADDSRQLVEFPDMMKNHMLANMRDHLVSLTEIQQFIAAAEYEKASEVAEKRLGLSSLDDHGAAHRAQMMPKEMQEIGTGMHKAASKFALSIEEAGASGDIKPALADLATLMQQCVSCHSAYRVH